MLSDEGLGGDLAACRNTFCEIYALQSCWWWKEWVIRVVNLDADHVGCFYLLGVKIQTLRSALISARVKYLAVLLT